MARRCLRFFSTVDLVLMLANAEAADERLSFKLRCAAACFFPSLLREHLPRETATSLPPWRKLRVDLQAAAHAVACRLDGVRYQLYPAVT